MLTKSVLLIALFLFICVQTTYADIYSQLQFIKIQSPKNGDNFEAGDKITLKYVMQPLLKDNVAAGRALDLDVAFHKRSGSKTLAKLKTVANNCPITAKDDKYVTYKKTWTVPKNTKPGSYAINFVEVVQLRRGKITVQETVKINITLSSDDYVIRAGGKGANQSIALAQAGANIYHAGNLGQDGLWNNGRAFIQVSGETGDNCIVLYPGTNHTNKLDDVKKVLSSFGKEDWIIQQNEINDGGEIMRLAVERGLSVLFNPAPVSKDLINHFPFKDINILVVNEHEAISLYEELNKDAHTDVMDIATVLMDHSNALEGVIITLGKEGVVARFKRDNEIRNYRIASRKVIVKDTTGAGDTFVVITKNLFLITIHHDLYILLFMVIYLHLLLGLLLSILCKKRERGVLQESGDVAD
ncbi:Ribokinase-like protein [Pilobolus umbonatus]|nr:Ribokinase-like protein [Pilobolus umbonatus]